MFKKIIKLVYQPFYSTICFNFKTYSWRLCKVQFSDGTRNDHAGVGIPRVSAGLRRIGTSCPPQEGFEVGCRLFSTLPCIKVHFIRTSSLFSLNKLIKNILKKSLVLVLCIGKTYFWLNQSIILGHDFTLNLGII